MFKDFSIGSAFNVAAGLAIVVIVVFGIPLYIYSPHFPPKLNPLSWQTTNRTA
jgi:hypothetical protein